jgi:hypothetical protein
MTRSVVSVSRSKTKLSGLPLPSTSTRFVAKLQKPTKRPSSEIESTKLCPSGSPPSIARLTRSVSPVSRS